MNTRLISALLALPILFFVVISGGYIFDISIAIITCIAIYEYTRVYKPSNIHVMWPILGIGYVITFSLVFLNLIEYSYLVVYLVVIASMALPIFFEKYDVISSAVTITGFVYIVNFFVLLIPIRGHEYGSSLIWLVLLISFFCDTFAYYTGRSFGKHKLCERVSPKKTIEGSIGGILGSIVGVTLWGYFSPNVPFTWIGIIILAIVASIISQIGDLSASLIKRYSSVKDYGRIMPGHGGILDRFDSILFTTPVVYCYIIFFIG
ncbi:MAG: phosphatidate cytidylyltransferase [Clostridium sp.]